jgi:thiamine biosynthesis lipoprotein
VWDLEGPDSAPSHDAIAAVRRAAGHGCFDLRRSATAASRECGAAWIDSRVFERGAALAHVGRIFASQDLAAVRVDLGGHLLVTGPGVDGRDVVGIADPRGTGEPLLEWPGARGAIATASQPVGSPGPDGRTRRVLDPRSGGPVEPWGSVTIRTDDPLEADALSYALFVMGPKQGIRWLAARPEIEALFLVESEGEVRACGRTAIIEALVPVTGGVRRFEREITPGLIRCR